MDTPDLKKINLLLNMDLQSIYILGMLSQGYSSKQISKKLGLSPPAICQRLKRFNEHVGHVLYLDRYIKFGSKIILTPQGKQLGEDCCKAMDALGIRYSPKL
jgi:DNA-binding transcriptional LysR family regulator